MKFQRAHRSIIRSIRQVALAKEWQALRGGYDLPLVREFQPDERAGDAQDLVLNKVVREDNRLRYLCKQVGDRVVMANGAAMKSRFIDECYDPSMLNAVAPLWDACLNHKLPIYSIVPTADRDGCPVTLEKLYLPFSSDRTTATYLMVSLHAFSTEGRFVLNGVLRLNTDRPPLHWAVLIDPDMPTRSEPRETAALVDDVAVV